MIKSVATSGAGTRLGYACSPLRKQARIAMATSSERVQDLRFDFPTFLETKKSSIASALDHAIALQRPASIYESMRYSVFADSSRICPLLCISACELVGGSQDMAMPMACALEMMLTASFMHDDLPCMDNDERRRGKAANHKVFGEEIALLASDGLYALGVQHVATNSLDVCPEKILRVIAELAKVAGSEGVVAGRYLELAASNEGGQQVTLEGLQYIHLHKMAAYAECSTVCGAILGDADEDQIESLQKYGRALGLLYEFVEDMTEQGRKAEKPSSSYIRVLGFDKCKVYGKQLCSEAKSYLLGFDAKKALPLQCFVDQLADRVGMHEGF